MAQSVARSRLSWTVVVPVIATLLQAGAHLALLAGYLGSGGRRSGGAEPATYPPLFGSMAGR